MSKREKILNKLDNFTNKFMPREFSKYLIYAVVGFYVFNYIAFMLWRMDFSGLVSFNRDAILRGEVWRLITFIIDIGYGYSFVNMIFMFFGVMFYWYSMQIAIARKGYRRLNTFLFLLFIASIITGFIMVRIDSADFFYALLVMAGFLYPDFTLYLNFIIPVKGWIVSILSLLFLLYRTYLGDLMAPVMIGVIIFVFLDEIKEVYRVKIRGNKSSSQRTFKREVKETKPVKSNMYIHKCTVCGKTDVSHPDMVFRYCSKCQGAFEYCEDHIKDHEHRTNVVDLNVKRKED